MKRIAGYIKEALRAGYKPLLICAPADDDGLLEMLPTLCPMVVPMLVGNEEEIQRSLAHLNLDTRYYEVVHEPDRKRACEKAIDEALRDPSAILMEGGRGRPLQEALRKNRHTAQLFSNASHITWVDDPHRKRSFMVADTLIHPQPDLKDKIAILNTVLSVARRLESETPKVVALAALEYVNPSIPSTVDAAVLSKMAERHQFGDTLVEGPLDIDCALSRQACERKRITSLLEGNVDIFLVPDVHSGQSFIQFLSCFGRMGLCGMIAGLPVPVIVPMPYDTSSGRLASAAISSLLSRQGVNYA
ncbi:MAG TPA: hypothetical protein ENN34_01875 [Deltaproteobacteria bacterium]|nr:hypothetical protein [Deltaproteobacteria bacterium]